MSSPARLRDRRVIDEQIAELTARCDNRDLAALDFEHGAVAALRWLSTGGPSPLTGAVHAPPVTLRAIVSELAAAEDFIYGRRSRHRDYSRGVEHALMWAQFATAAPPAPVPVARAEQPGPVGTSSSWTTGSQASRQ